MDKELKIPISRAEDKGTYKVLHIDSSVTISTTPIYDGNLVEVMQRRRGTAQKNGTPD